MQKRPLRQQPLAYIDTETTGLDARRHEILEIAVVFDMHQILDILDGDEWGRLGLLFRDDYAYYVTKVRPERLEVAEPKALEVNGYAAAPKLWDGAPTFAEVADKVATLLAPSIAVGHNVGFDIAFIQESLKRAGNATRIGHHVVDTVSLAHEHLVPCGIQRLRLDDVCEFIGVSNEGHHSALPDALRARAVHKRLRRASTLDRLLWRIRGWRGSGATARA